MRKVRMREGPLKGRVVSVSETEAQNLCDTGYAEPYREVAQAARETAVAPQQDRAAKPKPPKGQQKSEATAPKDKGKEPADPRVKDGGE